MKQDEYLQQQKVQFMKKIDIINHQTSNNKETKNIKQKSEKKDI